MRWNGQAIDAPDDGALIGPGRVPGLLRSVRTPEFAGITFHEVRARSVLNRVPGESRVPFSWTVNPYRGCSHACRYCLHGDTPVLMADGRTKPIAELRVGDQIYGTVGQGHYRRYTATTVLAHWSTVKPAFRVTLGDGTTLTASGDHRFLTGRGWRYVGDHERDDGGSRLAVGDTMVGTGRFAAPPEFTTGYRRGYLFGLVRGESERLEIIRVDGEARQRARSFRAEIGPPLGWPDAATDDWCKGVLAGLFDAYGRHDGQALTIATADEQITNRACSALERFGFSYQALGEADRGTVRLAGGLPELLRFFHTVDPAIKRKRAIEGLPVPSASSLEVILVEPISGVSEPLFDVTTGTGDFIADGVVSHNCFARGSHRWLELDTGAGFDSEIVVKVNAAEVLARELAKPSWNREHVALGTNTDPYQRAEGRYRLMPGIISALGRSGTPFSILTKGPLLRRDLPLLQEVAESVPLRLAVSIAILDEDLHRAVEPGTPSPRARLDLVRAIRDAGFDCGVLLAPILPGLTDSREQLEDAVRAIAAAGATRVTPIPLHLRPGAREWFMAWLEREKPGVVARYRRLYGRGAYLPHDYTASLSARLEPLLDQYGVAGTADGGHRDAGDAQEPTQLSSQPEQLKLL